MERYFEGTPPTRRGNLAADRQGRGPGVADSDGVRFGEDGRRPAGVDRGVGALFAAAGRDRPQGEERGRRRGRGEGRPGRSAGGPSVQDPHRPVRAEAQFHPRFLGHAQEGFDRAGGRRAEAREAGRAVAGAGRGDRADRRSGPGRDRGRGQSRRPAHRLVVGRVGPAAHPVPHADGRPGRHVPRAAATRASFPGRCTRFPRRIPPSAAISTRRPRRWSLPA